MVLDEEKLINLISQYPELYDLQNEHYMNSTRKSNIWKEIAEQMGEQDSVCKDKWKCLRDSFNRSSKRRKDKSGDGAKKIKKWKFEKQMEFLVPYLQDRTAKSNIETAPPSIMSDDDSDSVTADDITSPEPEQLTSELSRPSSATSSMLTNITSRKKKRNTQPQDSVANVLHRFLESRPAVASSPVIESPMHSFFKAMADSVVQLPPDLQLKVKNKVYSIVSDAEYENIMRNSTSLPQQPATSSNSLNKTTAPKNIQHENDSAETDYDFTYILTEDGILVPQKMQ